ncbi:flagellar hook assembly protein FlgD [Sphingomonas sp. MAH-20]|uniref:Basal-body rod modification protein FlgD n=1 Tax=Sphingomonas horti TaxID=2682842 RepID=A0A6I4J2M9_9SPHN|nr:MULTISPECIES: flagellar hook assembly protein FlgD [Sphingomonas]MBA2918847.1 flagellar hook assembly protein FlgD [Sphingomonas sp. CGMCC 1.13658]MVO78880.1 flagellar hook assembly protein FlgD [Sphingomonas horti]
MTDAVSSSFDDTLAKLGISRTGAAGTPKVQTADQANALGQDSFLKLLTEQMKNQDPFDPVKNEDMVAQMATFSNVAGISEMNKTLKEVATRLDGANAAQAISYVGKTVLVEGDTAFPNTDGSLDAVLPLADPADDVQVQISDNAGNLLRTINYGAQGAGDLAINWDGKTDDGGAAPAGPYKITSSVLRNGTRVASAINVWAPVTSVSLGSDGGAPVLNLAGLGPKPLTAVRQVG